MGMAVGIPAGIALALLPSKLRWLAFFALVVVLVGIVSSIQVDPQAFANGNVVKQLMPVLVATASCFAAATMIVMIPVRLMLGKAVSKIREVTSVRTQVSLAIGIVAVLVITVGAMMFRYVQEQNRFAQQEAGKHAQLKTDFVRMAGEWYGFELRSAPDDFREIEQKIFVDIKEDGDAKVYMFRGQPHEEIFGDELIIKEATIVTPDVVNLKVERPEYRYVPSEIVLTRVGTHGPAWPRAFLDNPLLVAVDEGSADRAAELLDLIKSTARDDGGRAEQNVKEMLAGEGEYYLNIEYDYLADLADAINASGVEGIYRINGTSNAYAAFAYGSLFHVRRETGHYPCRLLYGLVYLDETTQWKRLPHVRPERVCNYSSHSGQKPIPVDPEPEEDSDEAVLVEEAMPDLDETLLNGVTWMIEAAVEQIS
jgi:Co/Zn/Cd efflux system component